MKKPKARRRVNKKLLALVAGVALLISVQAFINYLLWSRTIENDPSVVRSLVIEANDNLYRAAPVEATSGDIYLPEARLRIARAPGQKTLHYAYYPAVAADRQDEEVYLSGEGWNQGRVKLYTAGGEQTVSSFFAQVPYFQACSRQFLIKFKKNGASISTNYTATQHLTLADGRTAYLYENQDGTTSDGSFTGLYFSRLQSY
jgi:hypothetical protein